MVAGMDRKQAAGHRSVEMVDVAAEARETEAVLREIEAKVRAQNLGPATLPTGCSLTPPRQGSLPTFKKIEGDRRFAVPRCWSRGDSNRRSSLAFSALERGRSPAAFGPNLPADRSENNSLVGFGAVALAETSSLS